MARFLINQYTTANSSGPTVQEESISPAHEGSLSSGKGFKRVLTTVDKCNCVMVYNFSTVETVLVVAQNDSHFYEPIPPLTGRYLKSFGDVDILVRSVKG
jgi:hypothetical protein